MKNETEMLVRKYNLDFVDAFQLYTLKKGMLAFLSGESRPMLITADKTLAEAAKIEKLNVWNVMKESAP